MSTFFKLPTTIRKIVPVPHCMLNSALLMTCLKHFAHCRILLAEPTNEAVNRTVKRLKDKGYPLDQLEVVRGEHAFRTAFRVPGVRYTLITEFNPDENTQLLVGTVQVLARIGLHRDSHVGVMLKPPATVVV